MPCSGWLTTPYLGLGPSWDCSKREIDDVKSLLAVSDKLVAGDSPGYVSEDWGDTCWTGCDWVLDWGVVPPLWALEPSFPILCNKWLPATPNIQRVSNLLRKHLGVHLPRELVESCFALFGRGVTLDTNCREMLNTLALQIMEICPAHFSKAIIVHLLGLVLCFKSTKFLGVCTLTQHAPGPLHMLCSLSKILSPC